jgi:glycosyltransferase involved in cell wall biosynthesis
MLLGVNGGSFPCWLRAPHAEFDHCGVRRLMKIGVSGWRLSGQPLGVSRYIEYLLEAWQAVAADQDEVTVYICAPLAEERRRRCGRFAVQTVTPRLTNALWENLLLPLRATGLDVLFCPSYTAPLTYRGKTVVALHSADEAGKSFPSLRVWPYEQKYKWSARSADKVIVNAHSVKQGVIDCYGVAPDKIEVVYLAADVAFRPIDDHDMRRATKLKLLGVERPYILFVGGMSQRRNVPMLLEAFSILKREDKIPHAVLLVGPNRSNIPLEQLAQGLGISGSVFHTVGHFASHHEVVAIYNAADVFVLPSSSEGFSLTLIEAMSCGTPVITTNRAALGEVAHGHALTMDEPTVENLVAALRQVLTDEAFSQSLGERCLKRARDFSWKKTAAETLGILHEVGNG